MHLRELACDRRVLDRLVPQPLDQLRRLARQPLAVGVRRLDAVLLVQGPDVGAGALQEERGRAELALELRCAVRR